MKTNPYNKTGLIDSYLRGNLSGKKESELSDWISLSDKNYQAFKRHIEKNQFYQPHSDETIWAWQKLKAKIKSLNTARRISISGGWKVAAAIVIAILSGFFASQLINTNSHHNDMLNEVIIPNGEKAHVVLSDGTQVTLNAGTSFRYPATFSKNERKVILAGEAFFEVTKDRSHPFVIETPKFDVKVTGTSFNLTTYVDDEENSLSLYSGEVIVTNEEQQYKIRPGEKFKFNTATSKAEIEKADLQKAHLWTEGVTVIDNLYLEEIRKILERKFDVQIKIMNEDYKKIRYNGQFKPNETLENVLDLIKEASPVKFHYEINKTKKEVIIKS